MKINRTVPNINIIPNIILVLSALLVASLFFLINAFAEDNNLAKQLTIFQKSKEEVKKAMFNDSFREGIYDFILKNKDAPLKDFRKMRLIIYACDTALDDLDKRYGAIDGNFRATVKNERDKNVCEIAINLRYKYNFKNYYLCKGNNAKAMESVQKVKKLILTLPKDKGFNSAEGAAIGEEILEECKFESAAIYGLLTAYRVRNEREKFNKLMLRILREDQVDFDYSYNPIDALDCIFLSEYLFFFTHVNSAIDKLILSKEQVKFIAEDILTKHQELFNFQNDCYSPEGELNEYNIWDAATALTNVSSWLRYYKLDELNNKLLEKYFYDELLITEIQYNPQFKDFMGYLNQWKEQGKKDKKRKEN